ncbi:MAG: translesion DNA synthesis-associated protein ImuA [Proteobacteria bacterium]|jgi:SOS-response cell division inhibitor, blocks FtsZ ring formation|nr:translesion DNA synthesis-associated protein ImuA [Pseudomonadota bacterium]
MNALLEHVIQRQDTWLGGFNHGEINVSTYRRCRSTGYPTLDAVLTGGGWPLGNTIEMLSDSYGLGAMGTFLPIMRTLSERDQWQAFINPPCTPYAPLLEARDIPTEQVLIVHTASKKDILWSTEQAIKHNTCATVFAWLGEHQYSYAELRKLQLAATEHDNLIVLFRPLKAAQDHAPACLRLKTVAYREFEIIKQRGGKQQIQVNLPVTDDLPNQPQLWELPVNTPEAAIVTVA